MSKAAANVTNVNKALETKQSTLAQQIINKRKIHDTPIRIRAVETGCDPCNRKGLPINILYVHNTMHVNIENQGIDPERLIPGIVIKYKTSDGQARLHAHNEKMTGGCPSMWPPISKSLMTYGTIANSHMSVKLRLDDAKVVCKETGKVFGVKGDDEEHRRLVEDGHLFWVLSEDTTEEEKDLISSLRNADQNQNNSNSEASLMAEVRAVIQELSKDKGPNYQVQLSTIIQKVDSKSIVKIKPSAIGLAV
jgi:hypothetical protein